MKNDTIFVMIPSYRDRECQHTIKNLFERAAYPDRITVGICWQFDPEEDADCFQVVTRPDQVRYLPYHWKESKGANWARAEAAKLFDGETYTLVIDAHMRFIQDWDELMIEQLDQCTSEKAVLTVFPPDYFPPDDLKTGHIIRMNFGGFEADGVIKYRAEKIPNEEAPRKPFLTATVSQGFMFARSQAFQRIPFDPYIYFFCDEVTYAARLWTHGWDLYSPNKTLIWHYWERKKRKTHWDDHTNTDRRHEFTTKRAYHLVGAHICTDRDVLIRLDEFGLGDARSLAQYQEFSGVDFTKKTIQPFAKRGIFLPL